MAKTHKPSAAPGSRLTAGELREDGAEELREAVRLLYVEMHRLSGLADRVPPLARIGLLSRLGEWRAELAGALLMLDPEAVQAQPDSAASVPAESRAAPCATPPPATDTSHRCGDGR